MRRIVEDRARAFTVTIAPAPEARTPNPALVRITQSVTSRSTVPPEEVPATPPAIGVAKTLPATTERLSDIVSAVELEAKATTPMSSLPDTSRLSAATSLGAPPLATTCSPAPVLPKMLVSRSVARPTFVRTTP